MFALHHMFLYALFLSFFNSSIIKLGDNLNLVNTNCFGNFEKINEECISCKPGFIRKDNQCIRQIFQFASANTKVSVQNCEIMDYLSINCIICKIGFYKNTNSSSQQFGKCVKNDCQIYFEAMRQCLDSKDRIIEFYEPQKSYRLSQQQSLQVRKQFIMQHRETLQMDEIDRGLNLKVYRISQNGQQRDYIQEADRQITDIHSGISVQKKFRFHQSGCIQQDSDNNCKRCYSGYQHNLINKQCQYSLKISFQTQIQNKIQNCSKFKASSSNFLGFCEECDNGYFYSYLSRQCEANQSSTKNIKQQMLRN